MNFQSLRALSLHTGLLAIGLVAATYGSHASRQSTDATQISATESTNLRIASQETALVRSRGVASTAEPAEALWR